MKRGEVVSCFLGLARVRNLLMGAFAIPPVPQPWESFTRGSLHG